jgi:hypothetical protein
MDWGKYARFMVLGFTAFLLTGVINQVLGISNTQNLALIIVFTTFVPLTILFLLLQRFR